MVDGYGTRRVLIDNNETFNHCKKIVQKLAYSGFLGMDFILSAKVWYPIDFNPRMTNGIGFFKENSFDICHLQSQFDERDIISTIPYVLSTGKVFDIFKVRSDYFNIYDIFPGLVILFQLITAVTKAIFYRKKPTEYIKKSY